MKYYQSVEVCFTHKIRHNISNLCNWLNLENEFYYFKIASFLQPLGIVMILAIVPQLANEF